MEPDALVFGPGLPDTLMVHGPRTGALGAVEVDTLGAVGHAEVRHLVALDGLVFLRRARRGDDVGDDVDQDLGAAFAVSSTKEPGL